MEQRFAGCIRKKIGYRHNEVIYAVRCGRWQEFLDEAKLFPSTDYA